MVGLSMVGFSKDGVDAQIILLMLAILFSKNFSKREHSCKCDVFGKWGGFFIWRRDFVLYYNR